MSADFGMEFSFEYVPSAVRQHRVLQIFETKTLRASFRGANKWSWHFLSLVVRVDKHGPKIIEIGKLAARLKTSAGRELRQLLFECTSQSDYTLHDEDSPKRKQNK
jgi:hypothetical protein